MAHRGAHVVGVAEELGDRLGLRRGLDDDQRLGHRSLSLRDRGTPCQGIMAAGRPCPSRSAGRPISTDRTGRWSGLRPARAPRPSVALALQLGGRDRGDVVLALDLDVRQDPVEPLAGSTSCGRRAAPSSPARGPCARWWRRSARRWPRPRPNSLSWRSSPRAKAPNTQNMISAAAVMTRAVAARPSATAVALSFVRSYSSLIRREQEHLVVHRQAEHDGEQEHRDPRLDRAGCGRRRSGPCPSPTGRWRRGCRRRRRSTAGS